MIHIALGHNLAAVAEHSLYSGCKPVYAELFSVQAVLQVARDSLYGTGRGQSKDPTKTRVPPRFRHIRQASVMSGDVACPRASTAMSNCHRQSAVSQALSLCRPGEIYCFHDSSEISRASLDGSLKRHTWLEACIA